MNVTPRNRAEYTWARTGKSVVAVLALILAGSFFRHSTVWLGDGWPLARIGLVFALVAALIRKRWDVGLSLLAAALAMGLLFPVDWLGIRDAMTLGLFDPQRHELRRLAPQALELTAMVLLINVLGGMLGARDSLKDLIHSLEYVVRDIRHVGAIIPATIGLLPTPGGALLSAPIVGEVGRHVRMNPDVKTAYNYWFRHIWEYWWPLYPGVIFILNDEELGIGATRFILVMLPLTVAACVGGWFFIARRIPPPEPVRRADSGMSVHLKTLVRTLWPVAVVVAALLIAPNRFQALAFIAALIAVNLALIIQKRLNMREVRDIVGKIRIVRLTGLIFAVYILRAMFMVSEAAVGLPGLLMASRVPIPLVCFLVPWIVGLLTGYTLAGIVTALPLLMGFILPAGQGLRMELLVLAYAGSFTGVLVSPSHLCLTLTREYFAADFTRVYRRLAGPYLVVLAVLALLAAVVAWIG